MTLIVACHVNTSEIVWFSTEIIPGRVHDARLFDLGNLANKIGPNERILGDKAYEGKLKCISPNKGNDLSKEAKEYNNRLSHYRINIERAIERIKNYKILATRFRQVIEKHPTIWIVCVELTYLNNKVQPN